MNILMQIATAIVAVLLTYLVLRVIIPLFAKIELRDSGEIIFLLFRLIPVYRVHVDKIVSIERITFLKAVVIGATRPTLGWLDRPWGQLIWMLTDSGLNIVVSPGDPEKLIERVRQGSAQTTR